MRVADVVAIKNPDQLHSKLRRSRGSICPWLDLLILSITPSGHGIPDGALKAASLVV
ncbi:hypothetical protein [Agrobacterium larrymoorei]|uniref:Uncharacterized protein n=1 Tax=Agrobacterium larrymoorei TaxID=160699 RepID=A0AAF0H9W1_9HYPH|nr:hypothetical protein [Agrobacterium larrymoorei]WHA41707.1 hypothetical protein CFBP5477_003485 [Agrobacterium larrymoorei]